MARAEPYAPDCLPTWWVFAIVWHTRLMRNFWQNTRQPNADAAIMMTGLVADDLEVCGGFGSETPSFEDSMCILITKLIIIIVIKKPFVVNLDLMHQQ